MQIKNHIIVIVLCSTVAAGGIFAIWAQPARAQQSPAAVSALDLDQLEQMIVGIQKQLAQIIAILQKGNNDLCGNGRCDLGETISSCPKDCPGNYCSTACKEQGYQDSTLNCSSVGDKDKFNTSIGGTCCCINHQTTSICGDGICDANVGETTANCPQDCGQTNCVNKIDFPFSDSGQQCCAGLVREVKNFCVPGTSQGGGGCSSSYVCEKPPVCGNEICEYGETLDNCPQDCTSSCKEEGQKCEAGTAGSAAGCGYDCTCAQSGICVTKNICGNGVCEQPGEDAGLCPQDCGNNVTPNGEPQCYATGGKWDFIGCRDCVFSTKQERISNPVNPRKNCTLTDCFQGFGCACPSGKYWGSREEGCVAFAAGICGNGVCEAGETVENCRADCDHDAPTTACVGEGKPIDSVNELSCCPGLAPHGLICVKTVCGDGICDTGETASSCPKDCGCKRNGDSCCSSTGCVQKDASFGGQYWDFTGACQAKEFWSCQIDANGKCAPIYDGCLQANW